MLATLMRRACPSCHIAVWAAEALRSAPMLRGLPPHVEERIRAVFLADVRPHDDGLCCPVIWELAAIG
jgi:hypothetical protein